MSLNNNKQALFSTSKGSASAGGQKSSSGSSNVATTSVTASQPAPAPPQSKTAGMTFNKSSNPAVSGMSAEARQKKMNEAHEYYLKAEENLKTSFFSWKPDHLSAASNFERCGDLYKAAEQPKKAIKAYLLCAENYEKSNTLASAALNQAKAADLAREMGDVKHAVEILLQSAETWALHGDTQKYGETLEKVAKDYEQLDVNKAKEMHYKAFEVLCPESLPKEQISQVHPIIIDIAKWIFSFLVKNKFYSEALKFAYRLIDIYTAFELESGVCKSMAAVTILQICQGDVIKAQQTYLQDHLSVAMYMRSQECEFIDILILACTNQDDDLMDKAKMHPQLNYFDKELQHIVKNLSLFELLETGGSHTQTEVKPTNDSKASLFQVKKAARTETKEKEAPKETRAPSDDHHEDDTNLHDALNNLNIPDFDDIKDDDEHPEDPSQTTPPPTRPVQNVSPPQQPTSIQSSQAHIDEDEDEIDLS